MPGTAASIASGTDAAGIVVRGTPFNEEVRERARGAELRELRPEMPAPHRAVQVEHRLPLDDRVGADGVVPGRERQHLDLHAEPFEQPGDPAALLLHVDQDPHRFRHGGNGSRGRPRGGSPLT
jgi:hypothetical protein